MVAINLRTFSAPSARRPFYRTEPTIAVELERALFLGKSSRFFKVLALSGLISREFPGVPD
jgi:hypothetical protein